MRRYRSAITGRFVSAWYALTHPRTSISERRRRLEPKADVFSRPECVFHYCPCPRVCEPANRCINPLKR